MTDEQKPKLTETFVNRKIDEKVTAALKAARQTPTQRVSAAVIEAAEKVHGTNRPKSGYALIALAIVIEGIELARYWLINHPLHIPPQAIAGVIGFVGFYIRNPRQTKEGAMILVDIGTRIIGVIRTGKRAGDVKVVELNGEKDESQATSKAV